MKVFDAVVVGGGVAGAAVAIHLARDGHDVLLLEKRERPHHKVCGEFLSHQAVALLGELGLDLDRLGAPCVTEARLYSATQIASLSLPYPCRSLSRKRLDHELLLLCEASGVTVQRGSTVASISRDGNSNNTDRPGEWLARTQNDVHRARAIFLATGKWDLGSYKRRYAQDKILTGVKIHVRLAAQEARQLSDQVRLYGLSAGYAGLNLVEGGVANLCLVLHRDKLKGIGHEWSSLRLFLLAENSTLGNVLDAAEPCMEGPIFVSNLPFGFVREPVSMDCYCLGDQFAVIPSFTGRGLFVALLTAREAAKCFRLWGQAGTRSYNEQLNRILRGRMKGLRWIDEALLHPTRLQVLVSVLRCFPGASQWITRQASLV